jgi:hypothetical protein
MPMELKKVMKKKKVDNALSKYLQEKGKLQLHQRNKLTGADLKV